MQSATVFPLISAALYICVLVVSAAVGGKPERIGSTVVLTMLLGEVCARVFVAPVFGTTDRVALASDLFGFSTFYALSLWARRSWPIWASSLQLLSLVAHLVRSFHLATGQQTYYLMKSVPTYGVLAAIALGALAHARRQRSTGHDPAWRVWRHAPTMAG